ncbi:NUOC1 [Auxenochlorella protothecoides x Auxenochlorella symbiontica]
MGGASDLNVPKGIWSPAGGWYSDPKYWKRNTALAIGIIVAIAIPVFRTSVSKEQRYGEPQHDIPSQKWTPKENFHVAK